MELALGAGSTVALIDADVVSGLAMDGVVGDELVKRSGDDVGTLSK